MLLLMLRLLISQLLLRLLMLQLLLLMVQLLPLRLILQLLLPWIRYQMTQCMLLLLLSVMLLLPLNESSELRMVLGVICLKINCHSEHLHLDFGISCTLVFAALVLEPVLAFQVSVVL